MIDWVKARLPFEWSEPVSGGFLVRCAPDGSVERTTIRSAHLVGSFDEAFSLRTVERGWLEVDGNPSKFLQGHNLFGSDDLAGLTAAAAVKALRMVGRAPTDLELERWRRGYWDIDRVDVTQSFELPTLADVRAWLFAASEVATMKWKGRATMHGGTLYFGAVAKGKRGSRWSMKCYAKGDEIALDRKGHRVPHGLPGRDELVAWAGNKLRVEVLLRRAELERHGGEHWLRASTWTPEFALEMFHRYFGRMELGGEIMVEAKEIDGMKPAVKAAYNLWLGGSDLRGIYPRPTLYRHRREIQRISGGAVDILTLRPRGNVVPLRRVLELRPVGVPAWANDRGTVWRSQASG